MGGGGPAGRVGGGGSKIYKRIQLAYMIGSYVSATRLACSALRVAANIACCAAHCGASGACVFPPRPQEAGGAPAATVTD